MTKDDKRKSQILKRITSLATAYDKLSNNQLLIIYKKGYCEVTFLEKNFAHLCGIEGRNISAEIFFQKARAGKLSLDDIDFDNSHQIGLIFKKMDNLEKCIKMFFSGLFILIPFKTKKMTYLFATHDDKITLCFNVDKETGFNVPYSLRIESMTKIKKHKRYKGKYEAIYIFSKAISSAKYYHIYSKSDKKQK